MRRNTPFEDNSFKISEVMNLRQLGQWSIHIALRHDAVR